MLALNSDSPRFSVSLFAPMSAQMSVMVIMAGIMSGSWGSHHWHHWHHIRCPQTLTLALVSDHPAQSSHYGNIYRFLIPFLLSGQWELHGINCYQFFDIRHSWQKASDLCKRYGSDLVTVESFRQNNFTAELATKLLRGRQGQDAAYWLGFRAQNNLATNTLAAASGSQISQYYGEFF